MIPVSAAGLSACATRPPASGLALIAMLATPLGLDPRVLRRSGNFSGQKCFDRWADLPRFRIMEDLEFMTRLRRAGHSIRILQAPVLTSPRRHEREGLVRCTARNLLLRLLYHLGLSLDRLACLYRPHQE